MSAVHTARSTSPVDITGSAPAPSPRPLGLGEFFRYHGLLSPGVRLFRQLSFPAKSAWIAGAFLMPLVIMLAVQVHQGVAQIARAHAERAGLMVMRPLLDLIDGAQARRHSAALKTGDLAAEQQRVRKAFDALEATQRSVAELVPHQPDDELRKRHETLLARPTADSADETFALHDEYVDSLLDEAREIANASSLMLDPDLDTFHLMNVSVLRGPAQFEATAMLRTLAQIAMTSGSTTPFERDLLSRNLAVWGHLDDEIESSYQLAVSNDKALDQRLRMAETDDAAIAFIKMAEERLSSNTWTKAGADIDAAGAKAAGLEITLVRAVLEELDTRIAARIDRLYQTMAAALGIAAVFVAIAAYLLMSFYRVMMGGLREVDNHLREITRGNLTTAPRPWGQDEAAQLMITMREMQASLRRIVGVVLEGSAGVQTSSREIAAASTDLSARTERTAADLEKTSSTMEEISSTVKQTADTLAVTKAAVERNATAASHGGVVIRQVVSTMEGIQTSSRRIAEITGVIDGIAFQTNILALNAAVEAARAGDHGRGFAVVASEVRALAQRSAEAAREIKSLITSSTEQVNAGARVAADAGDTIAQMVTNAQEIGRLIGEVTHAAHEQSAGVGEVSLAVQSLDQATQQNAALVEETAAAASSMSDQARRLSEGVSFFKMP